ncbi:MAG: FliM/FliN family flagellar motor switch protein [bacterium]
MKNTKNITLFSFNHLPRITYDELYLIKGFSDYLSATNFEDDFIKKLCLALEEYMHTPVKIKIIKIKRESFEGYKNTLPEFPVCGIINIYALDKKVGVEIDPELSLCLINRLLNLNEKEENLCLSKPLTDIEEGILEYLLLKVMRFLHQSLTIELRLERLSTHSEDLNLLIRDGDLEVVIMLFEISLGEEKGFVNLLFPLSLVQSLLIESNKKSSGFFEHSRWVQIEDLTIPVRAQIGEVSLSFQDIENLEINDVILLDKYTIEVGERGLKGEVSFQIGEGNIERVKGEIVSADNGCVKIKITQL